MRAAVLEAPGGPDAFKLKDVPVPAYGARDVLVAVRACGVSGRDLAERNGTYKRHVTFPLVIGLEISGVVEAVGGEVTTLDQVITSRPRHSRAVGYASIVGAGAKHLVSSDSRFAAAMPSSPHCQKMQLSKYQFHSV